MPTRVRLLFRDVSQGKARVLHDGTPVKSRGVLPEQKRNNALPECSGRALLRRTAFTYEVKNYSQVKFATIRRFVALPALVLLLATGLVSP